MFSPRFVQSKVLVFSVVFTVPQFANEAAFTMAGVMLAVPPALR